MFAAGGVVRIAGEQQWRVRVQGHGARVEGSQVRRLIGLAFLTGTLPSGGAGGVLQGATEMRVAALKKPGAAPHHGWSVKTMMLPVESQLSLLVSISEECDQDRLH